LFQGEVDGFWDEGAGGIGSAVVMPDVEVVCLSGEKCELGWKEGEVRCGRSEWCEGRGREWMR
jgi:hypothetical protein